MRIGPYQLFGRKPKPVIYLDLETREPHPPGKRINDEDIVAIAYKVGDGPVVMLPWEAACARGDWPAADRLHAQCFAEARRQHVAEWDAQVRRSALLDQSWLTRKFLTLAARVRTLIGR